MQFGLSDEQRALVTAMDALLEDHAGAARAIELGPSGFDASLAKALARLTFVDTTTGNEVGRAWILRGWVTVKRR